ETRRRILRMIARGPGNRQERAVRFERRVSIHAVREILRDIRTRSAPTFKGFSYKMQKHADGIRNNNLFPEGTGPGSYYRDIYGGYLG
ncbi:MAG: hypothetical protein ABL958_19865, partial [Bdellovibrionia bacterium]